MSFFFVQLADPQFGLFSKLSGMDDDQIENCRRRGLTVRKTPKVSGFEEESKLYEKAIAGANRYSPSFVVVCGDLVNDAEDQEQIDELMRITAKLDARIPVYWVAGNHDVGNTPTKESMSRYRERFGSDNYAFHFGESSFIIINSCVCFDPSRVSEEWDKLIDFLGNALKDARDKKSNHILIFMHHPLFLQEPEEEEEVPFVIIPKNRRRVILEMIKFYNVSGVFAGHWPRNVYGRDGDMEMVTSGPVGYPFGNDPSGLRIVKVFDDRIEHQYYGLDYLPDNVEMQE